MKSNSYPTYEEHVSLRVHGIQKMESQKPEIEIIENRDEETELEPLYRVIIHNDDVTPMDFVVHVLLTVFLIPNPAAAHIMLTAHLNNHAHVQTLPKQEARKRINQAHFLAAMKNYPLHFTMEPD